MMDFVKFEVKYKVENIHLLGGLDVIDLDGGISLDNDGLINSTFCLFNVKRDKLEALLKFFKLTCESVHVSIEFTLI